MTEITNRLLQRLLNEPGQVEAVRALEPLHFVALVASVGLEDSGEVLAMATAKQIQCVLDEELWGGDPTRAEPTLDAQRFAVWLEVLLEGGDEVAARHLAELPEELLSAVLCDQLFVLEIDALGHDRAAVSGEDAELVERVLDESLHLEFGRYVLIARHALGWDPTIAGLLAVDRVDHALVERVLERCLFATTEQLADDGLSTILRAQQTLEADALAERDDRRDRVGYVSRASASSFLALAEQTSLDDASMLEEDPVTRAYFRDLEPCTVASAHASASPSRPLRALVEHLEGLGGETTIVEAQPSASLTFREAMQALHAADPKRHAEQLARLGYLANVLMSARRPDGEARNALEASELTMRTVARGLDHLSSVAGVDQPTEHLQRLGVDVLFRLGWRL